MSPEAITTERVYQDLKGDLLRGRFPFGTALNVHAIAQEFGMSISPVRDALQRMVGERLLATRPSGGFEIPEMTEEAATDLYSWNAFLTQGAARSARPIRAGTELLGWLDQTSEADATTIAAITTELFHRVGETAHNAEHLLAVRAAGERLHGLRLSESCLSRRKAELILVITEAMNGVSTPLRALLGSYHRRRIRNIKQILDTSRAS